MLLSLVPLLLLVVRGSRATHFLGTMMTYYPEETHADGSVSVILRYKLNFVSCNDSDTWQCGGNCGTQTQTLALSVVDEVSGEWCQREGAITHLLPNNTGFQTVLAGGDWISDIQNDIISWRAVTAVELRNRSDIVKPNTSPQTTILPALRIPSNCPKTINLLAFDPDGDEVKCRYGNTSESECNPCTPPSVLSLSSSCSLSFSPTNSSNTNQTLIAYAVQLVMEDFPTQNITLTETDGSQEVKTPSDAISKIPLQFVLKVGPTVPSCTEGLYLPRFLSPTPSNRAQLYTPAGQALEVTIRAEATQSNITGLLYSGPYNIILNGSSGSGNFSLTWMPSASEEGQSHPVCFVVQTSVFGTLYHSDLRCVIVTVGNTPITQPPIVVPPTVPTTTALINFTTSPTLNVTSRPTTMTPAVNATLLPYFTSLNASATGPQYVIALNMKISTTLSLDNDYDTIINLIKNKLVERGLPSDISLRLLSNN
ncbi:uncharacterized protein LOC105924405 isoform X1 [Fundulus heteroclitus]|uniref:uncharacterized protein LOC105924405 isoform X1 n=1 Tax=Fundulus heteroclitus TaxID=8078 RepID=UPI00165AF54F|nr:uncharacterized protein LOC105924405 isoform X1 [Fundulus heteroclitus]